MTLRDSEEKKNSINQMKSISEYYTVLTRENSEQTLTLMFNEV